MKSETAGLLQKYFNSGRIQFVSTDLGLEVEHNLTDQEKEELAHLEYGKTFTAPLDELFVAIMRKTIKLAAIQINHELGDKLSDL